MSSSQVPDISFGVWLCSRAPAETGFYFRPAYCISANVFQFLFSPFVLCFAPDAQKCELICQSEGTGDVVFMNQVVHDGTRCSYRDPYSICVRGECVVRS